MIFHEVNSMIGLMNSGGSIATTFSSFKVMVDLKIKGLNCLETRSTMNLSNFYFNHLVCSMSTCHAVRPWNSIKLDIIASLFVGYFM